MELGGLKTGLQSSPGAPCSLGSQALSKSGSRMLGLLFFGGVSSTFKGLVKLHYDLELLSFVQ